VARSLNCRGLPGEGLGDGGRRGEGEIGERRGEGETEERGREGEGEVSRVGLTAKRLARGLPLQPVSKLKQRRIRGEGLIISGGAN
jgi:hypothetical protein